MERESVKGESIKWECSKGRVFEGEWDKREGEQGVNKVSGCGTLSKSVDEVFFLIRFGQSWPVLNRLTRLAQDEYNSTIRSMILRRLK